MVERAFIGTWKVIGSSLNSYERCTCTASEDDLKGVKFTLGEKGDVTWVVPERLKFVPLFKCDTYEYHIRTGGIKIGSFVDLRFGAYAGLIFEFNVLVIDPEKQIILKKEDLYDLNCIRLDDTLNVNICDCPFTLLPALEEGYFSDITLTAANNKKFHVHSIILKMQGKGIDWLSDPPPFDRQPEDVLGTILHFIYTESLPDNLTQETAEQVMSAAASYPTLTNLVQYCEKYIKRIQLKEQIIAIVTEMHNCMDRIVYYINPCSKCSVKENLGANPSKLLYAIKQSFKEEVVAIVKFVLLCDIFTKNANNLTSSEQDEIMLLLKSKVPVYNNQFRKFLEGLKKIYRSMSPTQRVEVALFIVPEIEVTLGAILSLLDKVDKTLQQIIHSFGTGPSKIPSKSEENNMSMHLSRLVHRTEFNKLISFHENIKVIFEALSHKKEQFLDMTPGEQVQIIARNLDFFIKELPIFLIRLDEIVDVFDEKLELHEFKFFFKAETSKIAYILEKLRENVDASRDGLHYSCELMQKDCFNKTLYELGLLDSVFSSNQQTSEPEGKGNFSETHSAIDRDQNLNLVKSLCNPPKLYQSELSRCCLKLLTSQIDTDMEFEVTYNASFGESKLSDSTKFPETSECVEDSVESYSETTLNDSTKVSESTEFVEGGVDSLNQTVIIKAHRVIVASRCDWFRRALQSGMKEDINKKILIPDTNPALFQLFLEYLYSGKLDGIMLSSENLLELLLLSDKYEMDSLKQVCECYLKPSVDADSALYFLSIADQYNACILKSKCINYISQHKYEITETDEFYELPISLQNEIFDTLWTQPKTTTSSFYCDSSTAGSYQNEDLSETTRLEDCLSQLRSIIGDTPTRSYLVQLILAADYNLQRAVNFYYSDSSS